MGRSTDDPIPYLDVDPARARPLRRQIYDAVRRAITDGRMAPGAKLPATRVLATDLAVSRTTVNAAYAWLRSEGYVEARVGSGTRVASPLPEEALRAVAGRRGNGRNGSRAPAMDRISDRGRRLAAIGEVSDSRDAVRPFLPGVPALDTLPRRAWFGLYRDVERLRSSRDLGYPDPAGFGPLRSAIADHLRRTRGMRCDADHVVITSGSQEAVALIAAIVLDPGDAAWLEDPGLVAARRIFREAGARVVPVPVDDEGLAVEEGERAAPGARVAYVTPSHQFPLGATLSRARRIRLLEWAERTGAWIIEDDYDGEYRFERRPLQALHGLDRSERVIYVGTFSKMLFPALRLGFAVLPPALVAPFRAAKFVRVGPTALLPQIVLTEFFARGHLSRHLRRMRLLYMRRRETLATALRDEADGWFQVRESGAGMHLVAALPRGVDDADISRRAAQRGVTALPLSWFSIRPPTRGALVLGYGGYPDADLRRAARELAKAALL